ncbi:MAG: hypothetical protein JSR40_04670, partial [Proteobacteria bacterium]|nr:hypothetical protein [Pseudomonadota bacterium]
MTMNQHPLPGAHPRTVVIIGAGFSGTLTTVNILREAKGGGLDVVLIEQR